MDAPPKINPDWEGEPVIVAGSGPSFTPEIARTCRLARWIEGWRVIAVNDAYKRVPWADALYGADWSWWELHKGAPDFHGERFSSHSKCLDFCDDKLSLPYQEFKLTLVAAEPGTEFSRHSLRYGWPANSGFQAVNLAIMKGASRVVLVGFDYQFKDGQAHFFGAHPVGVRQFGEKELVHQATSFKAANSPVPIINATPDSALKYFPTVTLDEALRGDRGMYRNWPESDARAD